MILSILSWSGMSKSTVSISGDNGSKVVVVAASSVEALLTRLFSPSLSLCLHTQTHTQIQNRRTHSA